jgi:hypothetical protein
MLISSHLTTTIFWPERICLEMIEAKRPRRCPLPSMTMGVDEKVAMLKSGGGTESSLYIVLIKSKRYQPIPRDRETTGCCSRRVQDKS